MKNENAKVLDALQDLGMTSKILSRYLLAGDSDKAHEAVTILLMQGIDHFGPDSSAMQQFFPVFESIKNRIDQHDLIRALDQTKIFEVQLQEIIGMMPTGAP